MHELQSWGHKVILDVQPQPLLVRLQAHARAGKRLYPHEERLLWSGETTYPAPAPAPATGQSRRIPDTPESEDQRPRTVHSAPAP